MNVGFKMLDIRAETDFIPRNKGFLKKRPKRYKDLAARIACELQNLRVFT